jgi:F0F1-type ATP synthase delta subunit
MTFTPINELPKPAQFLLDELEKEAEKEMLINNYMKEILETHPVANLKSILRNMKQEIGSYSKMKKAELISRIIALKKKGFPVPKVEKYVKPARKKVTKKTAPAQEPKKIEPKKAQPLFKVNDFSIGDNPYIRDKELNEIIENPKTYGSQSDKLLQAVFDSPKKAELEKLIKTVAGASKAETIKLLGKHFKFHKEDLQKLQKGDILRLYLQGKALYKDFFAPIDSYKRAAKSKDGITQTWAKINNPKMQAVVKYFRDVSQLDVKTEPKTPAPKTPAPDTTASNFKLSNKELNDKIEKIMAMDKKEYAKYLKSLPKKIPNEKDTKAVDEFLKAHEGLGFGWKFHKGKSVNDENFFTDNAAYYNGLSRNRKLKFLDLYINKTLPELKSTPGLHNLSGENKPSIISIIMNKPTDAELKKLTEESNELFTELDYRFRPKRPANAKYPPSKILKIGNEKGLEKAEELAKDLEINRNIIYRYTGKEVIEPKKLQYLFDGIKRDRNRFGAELNRAEKNKNRFTFTIDHSQKIS